MLTAHVETTGAPGTTQKSAVVGSGVAAVYAVLQRFGP